MKSTQAGWQEARELCLSLQADVAFQAEESGMSASDANELGRIYAVDMANSLGWSASALDHVSDES
jgi:hypothetical protein